MKTVEQRFWEKVGPYDDPNVCWLWIAATVRNSGKLKYGRFRIDDRLVYPHRLSYEMYHHVTIPKGMTIDHVKERGCTSTLCVNPHHLEVVTNRVNILRGNNLAALHSRQTHCKHGHQFTEENIYLYNGKRHCCVCKRMKSVSTKGA